MRYKQQNTKKQNGVVLVVVMLLVSLIMILLAVMVEDQNLIIQRTLNQKVAEQGYHYGQGLNAWAMRVLNDDANRQVDHSQEKWAKFGRPQPKSEEEEAGFSLDSSLSDNSEEEEQATIDFGVDGLEVVIDDLQGRFNLNNLSNPNKAYVNSQKRILLNLLGILEIGDFQERSTMIDSLVDWVDENEERMASGYESGDYQSSTTSYLAADQMLTSLGDLVYVHGFDREKISLLSEYVTVLPVDNAAININSASPEVLASLSTGTVSDIGPVVGFLSQQYVAGFVGFQAGDIKAAEDAIIQVSVVPAKVVDNMLRVNSEFFQIRNRVALGDSVYCTNTVVMRPAAAGRQDNTVPNISVFNREYQLHCPELNKDIENDTLSKA